MTMSEGLENTVDDSSTDMETQVNQNGANNDVLFPKIGQVVEDDEMMPTSVESLCMNCHEKGTTRLLFTTIPFFKEIVLMSFRCEHCGYSNNEVQPASAVQDRGCKYTVTITNKQDMDRNIVKSDTAVFHVKELDFQIDSGKGVLTTLEGLLREAMNELKESQDVRRDQSPEIAAKVDAFVAKLALILCGVSFPFTVVLEDPSGNSFIENPHAPNRDPNLRFEEFVRTKEQNKKLGLHLEEYENDTATAETTTPEATDKQGGFHEPVGSTMGRSDHETADSTLMEKEVYELPSDCPNCGSRGTSKTCLTDLPFFKEIIIMAFTCEMCGYKTNEIKGGGAIPDKGKVIRLKILKKDPNNPKVWDDDMKRDLVKSNSAGFDIPELGIEVTQGSLGGMYTTVEGILNLAKDKLFEGQAAEFLSGDSAVTSRKSKFQELEEKFLSLLAGEMDFTIELRDPLANSYIYSPTAPEPEERLTEETYERTFQENEDLGLNDMCTEGYETIPAPGDKPIPPTPPQVVGVNLDDGAFEGPFETFQGARPHKVFRLGKRGLGYYTDLTNAQSVAHEKMKNLQVGGTATHPHDVVAPK
mmetsp:Transcript_8805/g.14292  ORF Transcript_8805/g.14292 Transcript_8805/m.14292 type:complete len:586 (+) Transcript_8805:396-2153(+)